MPALPYESVSLLEEASDSLRLRDTRASGNGRVKTMFLAQIGPLTTLLGVAATAIGAGVVIGSATAGLIRLTRRRSRGAINEAAAAGGAVGGGFGAVALVVDLLLRYAG